jgi:glycine betaine/proline transport system ATP-binding protein
MQSERQSIAVAAGKESTVKPISMSHGETSVAVSCRNVWKVFGGVHKVRKILDGVLSGEISREEALDEHGCVLAVQDASFEVRRGEVFCIMGLSGSGKSTLIRHINRLIEPTVGDVEIDGQSMAALGPAALREIRAGKIGMVFQNVALLPHRTVAENTRLPLELRGEHAARCEQEVRRTLEIVGLRGWEDRYPRELSGGMQQRVGLARALAADASILLMDEPFSALDPLIRRQLQTEFRRLTKTLDKTALFITHDLEEAIRIGDRIAIMHDGRIVQIGTPEEIVMSPADDYVAQFVEGISRVHLVKAERVMVPLAEYARPGASAETCSTSDWPRVHPGADLDELIRLQLEHERPVIIEDGGSIAGVVGVREILKAVRAGRE